MELIRFNIGARETLIRSLTNELTEIIDDVLESIIPCKYFIQRRPMRAEYHEIFNANGELCASQE